MGQAKLRGDYAARKAEGEARRAAEQAQREAEVAAREAALTPAQRARLRHAQRMAGLLVGAADPATVATLRFATMFRP